jgi:hypothetical protein
VKVDSSTNNSDVLMQSMKLEASNYEDDVNLLDESYEKKLHQEAEKQ